MQLTAHTIFLCDLICSAAMPSVMPINTLCQDSCQLPGQLTAFCQTVCGTEIKSIETSDSLLCDNALQVHELHRDHAGLASPGYPLPVCLVCHACFFQVFWSLFVPVTAVLSLPVGFCCCESSFWKVKPAFVATSAFWLSSHLGPLSLFN